MASLRDSIKRHKQKVARVDRVGTAGVNFQDARARAAGEAGAASQAVKRVGEYKKGKVDKTSGETIELNRRNQENFK